MKFKKVLAGVLATSMVMTGTPAAGVGVFAAEEQNTETEATVETEVSTETEENVSVTAALEADETGAEATTQSEAESTAIAYDPIDSEMLARNASASSYSNKSEWGDMGAEYAFHGNHKWHQNYGSGTGTTSAPSADNPVWIQTKFDEETTIGKLDYVGRGLKNGADVTTTRITDYTILVADVKNGGEPRDSDWAVAATGTWPSAATETGVLTAVFAEPVKATHIRLVATGSSTNDYVCANQITIYKVTNREGKELQDLKLSMEPKDAGTIITKSSTGDIPVGKWIEGAGAQITLLAPESKYPFKGWMKGTETVSTDRKCTVSAGSDEYKAVYDQDATERDVVVTADASHVRSNSEKATASRSDGPAYWAFIDNGKWWHSFYSNSDETSGKPSESNPIWIEARFNEKTPVNKVTYQSRTDNVGDKPKCCIKDYKILVADTTDAQPTADKFALVASGQLQNTQDEQTITLPVTVNATHVRIVVTSTYDNSHITASKIRFSYDTKDETKDIVSIADSVTRSEHGNVQLASGSYIVDGHETAVTLQATPDKRYRFEKWTKDGQDVENGTQSQLTVNISSASELQQYKAVFVENLYYGTTKTYTAKIDGSVTVPSEDLEFYNNLQDLSITVTGKAQGTSNAYALFTLEGSKADGTKQAFTVWYNPVKGSMGYTGSGIGSGVVWSSQVAKIEEGQNFKANFSYAKLSDGSYYMFYSVNDVHGNSGFGGKGWVKMTNDSWNAFGLNFLDTHRWTVETVKVGEKGSITYPETITTNGSVTNCTGSISKVVVKNGIDGDIDTATAAEAATALINANKTQTEYPKWQETLASVSDLSQKDGYNYSNDSWNAFQTALKAEIKETSKDWEILNAVDAVKATAAALTKRPVNVTVADAENVTVTGKADSYTVGAQVSLTAKPADGYEFLYWLDTNKNTIVSTNAALEFTAESDITLKAVVKEKQAEQTTVTATFKTGKNFGSIIRASLSGEKGTTVTAPEAPVYTGYVFKGWAVDDGAETPVVQAGETYTLPEKDVTLVAVYYVDNVDETYRVTVTNEDATVTAAGENVAGQGLKFNTLVTVNAADKEGETFKNWTLADGSVVSTNKTYSFLLKKDMELTANYTTDVVVAKPSVALVLHERYQNGEKDKVRLGISWDNVEGYTIVAEGMLRTYDSSLGDAANLILTNSNSAISNNKCSQVGSCGNYTIGINLGSTKLSTSMYARGYVVYKDANGNIATVYTDVTELAPVRG